MSCLTDLSQQILSGEIIKVNNKTGNYFFEVKLLLSPRQKKILLAGGLLPYTRKQAGSKD